MKANSIYCKNVFYKKVFCKKAVYAVVVAGLCTLAPALLAQQGVVTENSDADDAFFSDPASTNTASFPSPTSADSKQLWQQQFSIDLPERSRSIRLDDSVDAKQWIVDNQLEDAKVMSLGSQGSIVDVPMSETEWQSAQNSLCQQSGVQLCEATLCRAIQFGGRVHGNTGGNAIKTRLVRNDPEQAPDNGSQGGSCAAPLAAALDETTAARNINLDATQLQDAVEELRSSSGTESAAAGSSNNLREIESLEQQADQLLSVESQVDGEPPAVDSNAGGGQQAGDQPIAETTADTTDQTTDPATDANRQATSGESSDSGAGEAAKSAFEYVLDSALGGSGELLVDATELPEDTTEWTLVVGEGCNEVRIPLDSLEPAVMPGRVVALTDAGVAAAVAAAAGATLESEVALETTDQSLAVFSTDDAVPQLLATLLLDPRVSLAQRDFIYRTTQAEQSSLPQNVAPETMTPEAGLSNQVPVYADTFAALTYGPKSTRALELHAKASGTGQIVAIIDTGMDIQHPELVDRIEGEPINTTEYEWSADAHGTAIAGIVAANANNSEGIFGVAPEAKVLAIKACHPHNEGGMDARCTTSTLVKALDQAMIHDATLINMSISGPPDELVEQYVQLALEQNRVVVAAAGNGGPNAKPGFPAAIPGVVAVTAIDANQRLYKQANHGEYIDVAAPGVDIIAPVPGGNYPALSGTSMAAAQVTGVVALLKQLDPQLDGLQISEWLTTSTHELGEPARFGRGLLDACSAAQRIANDACAVPAAAAAEAGEPFPDETATGESND